MSNPFPAVAETAPLRTLTESGIAHLRMLNERDEQELAKLRDERARLTAEIGSVDAVADELRGTISRRQAIMRGDVISQLPSGGTLHQPVLESVAPVDAVTNPPSPECRSCGVKVVQLDNGQWTHSGRELLEHGERCDPKNKQSPVAEPAKGAWQAFGDWSGAIDEERSGGAS